MEISWKFPLSVEKRLCCLVPEVLSFENGTTLTCGGENDTQERYCPSANMRPRVWTSRTSRRIKSETIRKKASSPSTTDCWRQRQTHCQHKRTLPGETTGPGAAPPTSQRMEGLQGGERLVGTPHWGRGEKHRSEGQKWGGAGD